MSARTAPAAPGARAVVDAGVPALAVGLALLPLVPVYGAVAVAPAALGGVALGTLTAALAAHRRWRGTVTAAALLVLYLVAGAGLATPTVARQGVLPTPESTALLLSGVVSVWKAVLTLDPPLGRAGGVLAAPFLLGLVGSAVAVSLALRSSRRTGAWAAAVPAVVLVASVLLGTARSAAPLAGVLAVVLLVPWVAWRRGTLAPRRSVASLLLGVVVVAAGATAGPVLGQDRPRLVLRDQLAPPFDPRAQASPLSAFRSFVKEWRDTDLLTVRGLPEGAAVRLATLDAFDGVVWDVAGAEQAEGSGEFRRVGDSIATSTPGRRAEVEMTAHRLPSVWLPTVGFTTEVEIHGPGAGEVAADLRYNDATGTAVLVDGVPEGLQWTADVVVPPVPDDATIGGAPADGVRLPQARGVPDAVRAYAADVVGTATSPVLVARSLEAGLAERGFFSHGLTERGDHPSLSGHGADRLTTLLTADPMVGDGEQYASAMALMAREMGLPARVVLGFLPDPGTDRENRSGAGTGPAGEITFTGADIAAWVEIGFAGHGWVPFHPTPDETRTPQDGTPQEEPQPEPQVAQPPPPPQEPVDAPEDDTEQPRTDAAEPRVAADGWSTATTVVLVSGVGVLALAAWPALLALAKVLRRRRRRARGTGVDRVVGGWEELLDHARDLRGAPPPAATRQEVAAHLARSWPVPDDRPTADERADLRASVARRVTTLASGADRAVFAAGEPTGAEVEAYWRGVGDAVVAMRTAAGRRRRWRARWSARSLRRDRDRRRRSRP